MPNPVRSEAVPVRPAQEKQVANAAPSQSSCPAPGVSVASGGGCEKAPPRPSGPLRPSSASLRGACHHPPLLPTRICFRIHCHLPPRSSASPKGAGSSPAVCLAPDAQQVLQNVSRVRHRADWEDTRPGLPVKKSRSREPGGLCRAPQQKATELVRATQPRTALSLASSLSRSGFRLPGTLGTRSSAPLAAPNAQSPPPLWPPFKHIGVFGMGPPEVLGPNRFSSIS